MVGRSLHREGILDCVAECSTGRAGRRAVRRWFSLQLHGPHRSKRAGLKPGADAPRRASFRETLPCVRVFHFREY
jgi:hypothetical protein